MQLWEGISTAHYLWSCRYAPLFSISRRNLTSGDLAHSDHCHIKALYLGGARLLFPLWGFHQIEAMWRHWSLSLLVSRFYSVPVTMVSGHRGRQRACWCQDQGLWPCHWITNTLSLCWGHWRERDWKKHYWELSRVMQRCSWEHRYDNGTDPISLWLITRTYPSKHCTIWCAYLARFTHQSCAYDLYECALSIYKNALR